MWKNINCADIVHEIKPGQILGHIENETIVRYKVSSLKVNGYAVLQAIDGGTAMKFLPVDNLYEKEWLIDESLR